MIITEIILEKAVTNKDGKHAVKLRFNFKREKVYINLKLATSAKNFNNGNFVGAERHLTSRPLKIL